MKPSPLPPIQTTPPPTPIERVQIQEQRCFNKAAVYATWWFLIIGIVVFIIMGGMLPNEKLKDLYSDTGEYPIYATINELRFGLLPFISFICVAFPTWLIILFFMNRYLEKLSANAMVPKKVETGTL